MCLLCSEIAKGNMTARETAKAFREFEYEEGHLADILVQIQNQYGDLDTVAIELSKLYTEEK